jgi:hypothetical protein
LDKGINITYWDERANAECHYLAVKFKIIFLPKKNTMQGSNNFFQKGLFLSVLLMFAFGNIMIAQDSNNEYQTFNFTFKGSKNTTKDNSGKKTWVIISGTMTNNETGETESVNITVNSSGTDENSTASATQQAEEKFWEKVKNFLFGKKKKGDGVMVDENGMGDYRPGGPMPSTGPWMMTFRLKNNAGQSASFRLNYRNAKQADQSFERDFHGETQKL